MPSVSVLVPTYNGRQFIAEALRSVFVQTQLPAEIIVVDDGSSDGTPELVERLAAESPVPLQLIRLRTNSGGPARPLNTAVVAARGEYVTVLDQDDLFLPDKLADQARVLQSNPQVVCVGAWCAAMDVPDRPLQSPALEELLAEAGRCQNGYWHIAGLTARRLFLKLGNFAYGFPGFTFRRVPGQRLPLFDETFQIAADYDFLCWLCTRGDLAWIPQVHYLRREHQTNASRQKDYVYLEVARVRAKHLLSDRSLLADGHLNHELRDWFAAMAYGAGEAGHFRTAIGCRVLSARIWGSRLRCLAFLIRLGFRWMYGAVGLRPCARVKYSNQRVEVL